LVLGNRDTNTLVAIKRVQTKAAVTDVAMQFVVNKPGKQEYQLFFISDSYVGVDQVFQVEIDVGEAVQGTRMDESSSDESSSDSE
jgi:pre-mRNA-splicing helicase BRR2